MKKKLFLISMLASLFSVFQASAQKKGTTDVYFRSNMHCASCEETLFEHLRFEKGVKELKVDHISNTVKVVFLTGKNSAETLAKAIEKKGYEANQITLSEYDALLKAGKNKTGTEEHRH